LLQKSKIERPGYEDADDLDHLWSDPVDAHLADYGCPLRRAVRNRSAILMGGGCPSSFKRTSGACRRSSRRFSLLAVSHRQLLFLSHSKKLPIA
jgi:hypothetical protein